MSSEPISPLARLLAAADAWALATGKPRSTLSSRATGSGKTIALPNPTLATLEKFARFLSDGGNWPEGRVPQVAVDFAHVVGISADEAAVSAGNESGLSAREAAA
ncbi:hypothetical protein GCM10022600_15190 [Qipengyuania pelagi]|uniref:Uncharacterized protein n=2 Tax=Qipengyuania pelagi TaxID=994320 RepID=A0A844Y720_9SPHN|nr:hypothetical protein [Qipengyuania pelagi]